MRDGVERFLKAHKAIAVGATPVRPVAPPEESDGGTESFDFTVERDLAAWAPMTPSEAPAKKDEYPVRFIDGSIAGQPVVCLRSPQGYPVPLYLAEVGAVALRLKGRRFERDFRIVERVLGFVADPFPWEQVEAFAADLANDPRLPLRTLPANEPPDAAASLFDYEAMRAQARARCHYEMLQLERLALAVDTQSATLVDGPLGVQIGEKAARDRTLLVGAVKTFTTAPLHPRGWQALLDLRPGQRTPYFQNLRITKDKVSDLPVASWYLRIAGGPQGAPNWGVVRIDVPWVQLERHAASDRSGFVDRLSRWLVDARCRTESYARMPISLDPIVRAEEALKPLFTPLPVLVNRLYRRANHIPRMPS